MFTLLSKVDSGRSLLLRALSSSPSCQSKRFKSLLNPHHQPPSLAKMSSGQPSSSSAPAPRDLQDYSPFLNKHSAKRQPSLIRELTKMLSTASPGTIFMAGGLPNPSLFPFTSLSVTVDDPSGSSAPTSLSLSGPELRSALQYQPTMGYPPLLTELSSLVSRSFPPPPSTWTNTSIIVTVGSQNALSSILEMCMSPGDPILVPSPCYSSALSIMDPHSPLYLTVSEDSFGMQPCLLRSLLEHHYSNNPSPTSRPKLLYVNPTGCNPSGVVIPTERKREIYRIAQQYDLLILEDDPYYFLHFLPEDPTTFLSMDVDGRVIRLDSFSKILSSGLRVGFCTGPQQLIRSLELCLQASILHTASISQVLVHGVLRNWGEQGFKDHVDRVKAFYKRRRDLTVQAAEKHLTGLAEWTCPKGGMFLWVKALGIQDTYKMLMEKGLQMKIMALPGRECMADKSQPCPYFRLSFSVVAEEDIEQGMIRLATLIKEEQANQL